MRDVLQLLGLAAVACATYFAQHEWRRSDPPHPEPVPAAQTPAPEPALPRPEQVVHVFVALCDNRNQGIVPVLERLGNGQDPANNLYWGAAYGVKTFFRRSPHWQPAVIAPAGGESELRDRAAFVLPGEPPVILVAEAYDGAHMEAALRDFFGAAAGRHDAHFEILVDGDPRIIKAGGESDLVAFVGHNGLMDDDVELPEPRDHDKPYGAIVLACKSAPYFEDRLRGLGCRLFVSTTGFMAPEAYTLDAIVRSWAAGESAKALRHAAAEAYARYQRCSIVAAERLFGLPANTR